MNTPTPSASPARTVVELWQRAVERGFAFPPFLVQEEGGAWRPVGWDEAARAVDELAAGFVDLGIAKGDRVAILSRTRLEWTLCDYALASIGAVSVPIYPTSSAVECAYILGNSGAGTVVCENADQAAKVAPARREIEALGLVVVIEGEADGACQLAELRERGRARLDRSAGEVAAARAGIDPDDILTLVYTSGTTGPAKGCVLAHRNYATRVEAILRIEGFFRAGDRGVLHLPLAHTFGRLVQYAGAGIGITIAFCPDVTRLRQALVDVRPTVFPSVPRVFERVQAGVRAQFEEATGPRRHVIDWALRVGKLASRRRQQGQRLPPRLALQLRLADRLVYSKVKERLGGELRFAISGSAPLAREVIEFFDSLGVLVLEGYGLTEATTVVSVNRPDRYRFGTVGPAAPGVEVEIAADGEILVRGETVFLGYHVNERATREVLGEDGWLRTGDLGSLDADGFLSITDRKKDIIVTAGGKNVSPQNIENALKASRYISEALVVGDGRPYLVALLAPEQAELERAGATEDERRALLKAAVDEVNGRLGQAERVRRFAVIAAGFSEERAEVTPTLKLRRRACEEHYRDEIEALYRSGEGRA